MTEKVTLLSNCGRESVEQIMKNYFMEFKRFFNISSTKNKICRLNLCHALKSRINFKAIEWQLNTVMFCSRQHIYINYLHKINNVTFTSFDDFTSCTNNIFVLNVDQSRDEGMTASG